MCPESKAEEIQKIKAIIQKTKESFPNRAESEKYSKAREFREKVLVLQTIEKKINDLEKEHYSEFFRNRFDNIKKFLKDTKHVDSVRTNYEELSRNIILYQNNMQELSELREKLDKFYNNLGDNSSGNLLKQRIEKLKNIKDDPISISDAISTIKEEIPKIEMELKKYNQKMNELKIYKNQLLMLKEEPFSKSFEDEIDMNIKKCEDPNHLDFIKTNCNELKKNIEIYQHDNQEYNELYKKLDRFYNDIGDDSQSSVLKQQIENLRNKKIDPGTISDAISAIKEEIPNIEIKIKEYNQKMNELKIYNNQLIMLKKDPFSKFIEDELDDSIKKCKDSKYLNFLNTHLPEFEGRIFISKIKKKSEDLLNKIKASHETNSNIYFEDISEMIKKATQFQDEKQLDNISKKITTREELWREKNIFMNRIENLTKICESITNDYDVDAKTKCYNLFINDLKIIMDEIRTEEDDYKLEKIKNEFKPREEYLITLNKLQNRYKKLNNDITELKVHKDETLILLEINMIFKEALVNNRRENLEKLDDKIRLIEDVYKIKNDIIILKKYYPECVNKFNLEDRWRQLATNFDTQILNDISKKIDEGKKIINQYNKLKVKIETEGKTLNPDLVAVLNQKLERGKKEVKKVLVDEVNQEITKLLTKPDIGFGRKNPMNPRWSPDWDSYGEH